MESTDIETTTTRPDPPLVPRASPRTFGARVLAALKLDASLYEEVEHDPSALPQAAAMVALAALASAVGSMATFGGAAVWSGLFASFVIWLLWTAIVWFVGVKIFEHTSDFQELLRTLGFVAAPQLLYVVAVIPVSLIQGLVGIVVTVMTFIAFVRATRQALDVETGRAMLVAALGVGVYLVLGFAVGGLAALSA